MNQLFIVKWVTYLANYEGVSGKRGRCSSIAMYILNVQWIAKQDVVYYTFMTIYICAGDWFRKQNFWKVTDMSPDPLKKKVVFCYSFSALTC